MDSRDAPDVLKNLIVESHLELSNSGITVVDTEENIAFWNQRFLEIWGLKDEDLKDRPRTYAVEKVLDKIVDPEAFKAVLDIAYADREYRGVDYIEFKNGTHIERKTQGQEVVLALGAHP